MPYVKNFVAAPALLAALSLTATPASAADMNLELRAKSGIAEVLDIEVSQTANHGRHHRYRYRRGPDFGDVVAGVLIVGAIAHIANSASRDDRDRDRDRDRRSPDYRRDASWDQGRGLDRAVGMCIDAVERQARVETVDRADRVVRGWRIEGTVSRGGGFTCDIDSDGRGVDVSLTSGDGGYERDDRQDDEREYREDYDDGAYDDIDYGRDDDRDDVENDGGYDDREDDDQWDDERYSSEWSKLDRGEAAAENREGPTSTYPGGPVGEEGAEVGGDLEIGTGYPGAGA